MKKFLRFLTMIVGLMLALAVPSVHGSARSSAVLTMTMTVALAVVVIVLAKVLAPKWGWSAGGRRVVQCGGVNISLTSGGLGGTLQTADGVVGFVMTGVSEGGGYTLGTPILVTGMANLVTQGITAANNPYATRHMQEFYNQAGDGADCYLMLVANTMTVAVMALNSNASGVVKLLNFAAGAIKVVGLLADDAAIHTGGGTITITNGMNADCYTAASNLKTTITGNAYASA